MESPDSPADVQRLVNDYYAVLYRYAYRLTGSVGDAEDLTQEAFCKAQAKLDQLKDAGRARAWLFTILRNAYLHRLRADRQRHETSLELIGEVPEPLPRPLPPVDPRELQDALNELPETFRTPLVLYYFDDFSYRDIAEQMGLPLGTVMSRLARAKAHLRARLLAPPVLTDAPRRAADGL